MGEDTEFYLAKGFRVVAIEASPELAARARETFREHVASGRLTVLNVAIAAKRGPIQFFANPTSEWGTTMEAWADRNAKLGSATDRTITVMGLPFDEIVAEFGVPYYAKIDIEGSDMLCVEALKPPGLPQFISIESDKISWKGIEREFEVLTRLGYRRFKIVPQHRMNRQRPPKPAREGVYVDTSFSHMSSGLFGRETPGRWLSARQALAVYRLILLRYRLYGDTGKFRGTLAGKCLRALMGPVGWFDTHASL
jgi:FkbM family methyltransferase